MLTPKQAIILRYIMDRIEADGVCPSYQEITDGCGLSSKSRVAAAVSQLVERGYLARLGPDRRRALRVLRNPDGDYVLSITVIQIIERLLRSSRTLGGGEKYVDVRLDRQLWMALHREIGE